MGSLDVSRYDSIYLDTSIYIYFFEDHPKFGRVIEEMLSQVIDQNIPVFASELLFTELLVLPLKEENQDLVEIYRGLPGNIPSLHTVAMSRQIAITAAELRAKYGLLTPDAIHLATAIESKTSVFICNDKKLQRVREIKIEILTN